jgi:putative phosphonate metabolism protein
VADGPRFAIYFVPAANTALYRFGAAVLGYDCYTGEPAARPRDGGLTEAEWAGLTAEPRTYGFHATLKAPFRLRDEFDRGDLLAELKTLAASLAAIPTFEPAVGLIGGFVAILPRTASPALDQLAADCVTGFERFRLPMTAPERAGRLAAGLSPRQTENLDRYGYPYVFEEFRFHMTLAGQIEPERRAAIHALLQTEFVRLHGLRPVQIDQLALVRQHRPDQPFRVIGRAPLRREPLRRETPRNPAG